VKIYFPCPISLAEPPTYASFSITVSQTETQSQDRALRTNGLPHRTPQAHLGGTHISLPKGVTHLAQSFVAGNSFNLAGAHFVPSAFCFGCPKMIDAPKIVCVEALNKKVC